jgi:hypothetical protein
MKTLLVLFGLFLAFPSFASSLDSAPFRTVTTSGTVANHFSDSAGKLASDLTGFSHMKATSTCASMVWLNLNKSSTTPSDSDAGNIPLWPGETFTPDFAVIRQSAFVRSSTGGSLSCDVYLTFW